MDGLLLVLAVGAHVFPQKRYRIQSQNVYTHIGQEEHFLQHGLKDIGVAVVEVQLKIVEGGPGPSLNLRLPGEIARCKIGEDLGQGFFVGIGQGAIFKKQVKILEKWITLQGCLCPLVLAGGMVHHVVDHQNHAFLVQAGGQFAQLSHGAQAGVDFPVIGYGVAPVIRTRAWLKQGHQVQIGNAQFLEIINAVDQALEVARKQINI